MNKKKSFVFYKADTNTHLILPYADQGVRAGFPSPAQDYISMAIDLNTIIARNPLHTHYYFVDNDSLCAEGIYEKDILVFDDSVELSKGDMVLCIWEGNLIIRRFQQKKSKKMLVSLGVESEPLELTGDSSVTICGVITSIMKLKHRSAIYSLNRKVEDVIFENDSALHSVDLNKMLIRNPLTTFYCRVAGDSMRDEGIADHDIVVVDKSIEPDDGDLAVCYVDNDFTMKRIRKEKDILWLVSANESYPDMKITADNDFRIWGIVTCSVKIVKEVK